MWRQECIPIWNTHDSETEETATVIAIRLNLIGATQAIIMDLREGVGESTKVSLLVYIPTKTERPLESSNTESSNLTLREVVRQLRSQGDRRIIGIPLFRSRLDDPELSLPKHCESYKTLGDVPLSIIAQSTELDMLRMRKLGDKGLRALQSILADHGLRLQK